MDMMNQMAPQGQEAPLEGQDGYVICIYVSSDGSLSVAREAMHDGQGQPAGSIGEALKAALQIYQAESGGEDEQIQSGYSQSNGPTFSGATMDKMQWPR